MLQKPLSAEAADVQSDRARSMEVVGQLTGGIAHDFNNILTVISGTIDILAEAVADRPDLRTPDQSGRDPRRRADGASACVSARPAVAAV